jgi:hypothetical protein
VISRVWSICWLNGDWMSQSEVIRILKDYNFENELPFGWSECNNGYSEY